MNIILLDVQGQKRMEIDNFEGVSSEIMLDITVQKLDWSSYLDISWPYKMQCRIFYICFYQVLNVLERGMLKFKFPVTEEEWK